MQNLLFEGHVGVGEGGHGLATETQCVECSEQTDAMRPFAF